MSRETNTSRLTENDIGSRLSRTSGNRPLPLQFAGPKRSFIGGILRTDKVYRARRSGAIKRLRPTAARVGRNKQSALRHPIARSNRFEPGYRIGGGVGREPG